MAGARIASSSRSASGHERKCLVIDNLAGRSDCPFSWQKKTPPKRGNMSSDLGIEVTWVLDRTNHVSLRRNGATFASHQITAISSVRKDTALAEYHSVDVSAAIFFLSVSQVSRTSVVIKETASICRK